MTSETVDPEVCDEASGRGYYVTAVDAGKFWKISGPYDTHAAALAALPAAREAGLACNAWAWFYSWGTAKLATREPAAMEAARKII